MGMSIVYPFQDNLYVNLTNRCLMACTYCIKYKWKGMFYGNDLRLDREPDAPEVIRAIGDPSRYKEIIFCGYGEPLIRLEVLKEVAAWVHQRGGRVRVNTSGHANVHFGRDITPELAGLVDAISISLNAASPRQYNALNRPTTRTNAFKETLAFVSACKAHIPEVTLTAVALPGLDVDKVSALAKERGVAFRLRPYLDENERP